jgi:hypothetical protein
MVTEALQGLRSNGGPDWDHHRKHRTATGDQRLPAAVALMVFASGSRYGTTKTMFVPGLRSIRACP